MAPASPSVLRRELSHSGRSHPLPAAAHFLERSYGQDYREWFSNSFLSCLGHCISGPWVICSWGQRQRHSDSTKPRRAPMLQLVIRDQHSLISEPKIGFWGEVQRLIPKSARATVSFLKVPSFPPPTALSGLHVSPLSHLQSLPLASVVASFFTNKLTQEKSVSSSDRSYKSRGYGEWAGGPSDTQVPKQLRQRAWGLSRSGPGIIRINDAEDNLWRHTLPAAHGIDLGIMPPFLPRVSFYHLGNGKWEQPCEITETHEYNRYTFMLCNIVT